jgi:DNA-binding NarL/FixJ family response regulator
VKPESAITVLVVDDHTIVRRGLVSLLSLNENISVVGEAADGRSAVEQVMAKEPDVVLMDISMPELNGLEATRQIKKYASYTKVLILSAYDNEEYIREIMRSGAHGYLLKNTSPEDLQAAVLAVSKGHTFFSPAIAARTIEGHQRKGGSGSYDDSGMLSPREREVLQLVAEGKTHFQIAQLLHISIRTVDTHRNNIMKKLSLHDTASLVTYAIKNGIVILAKS